jgi:hypothetical protein
MNKVWIFDIDGTLADNEHRQHHLADGKKEWDAFFAKQHLDEPYQPVLDVLHALANDRLGDKVIIVTARDERFREDTLAWVNKHIPWMSSEDVYMRPFGFRGNDDTMKVGILSSATSLVRSFDMIDLTTEGKQYIVYSKNDANKFTLSFRSWTDVENYIATEKGVYKIMSVESYEIPLTGLKVAVP